MNQEPEKCSRCKNAAAEIAMDCRRCHYVAIVMVVVHKRYEEASLEKLVDVLRGKSLDELQKNCPPTAYSSRAVFSHIRALAYPAKMELDAFKSAVANQILRDIGSFKGIHEYERLNGAGSYMRAWTNKLSTILKAERVIA